MLEGRTVSLRADLRIVLWLGILLAVGTLLGWALPKGPSFHPGGLVAKAGAWDAAHYDYIAAHGYRDPGGPSFRIAFFPGWPLLLQPLIWAFGNAEAARGAAMVLSGGIGVASILGFARLAGACVPANMAAYATTLYALYPGAHFLFQPYPTAVMQLCTIVALRQFVLGRRWRAATIGGAATAFGPLMVFTSAALVFATLVAAQSGRRESRFRPWLVLPVMTVLSLSGILLFILWQALTFGDPLAFVAAGRAWEMPMTLTTRAVRAAAMVAAVPDLLRAAARLLMAGSLFARQQWAQAQISYEDAVDLLVLFVVSAGAVAALWLREKVVALAALLTVLGFIWFAGAPQGGQAAIRLLYPAIGSFLGLAAIAAPRRRLAAALVVFFAIVLLLDQAFLVAGYWVV